MERLRLSRAPRMRDPRAVPQDSILVSCRDLRPGLRDRASQIERLASQLASEILWAFRPIFAPEHRTIRGDPTQCRRAVSFHIEREHSSRLGGAESDARYKYADPPRHIHHV